MSGGPETFDELDLFLVWTGFLHVKQTAKIQFKLGKKSRSSDSKFQTKECQKSSADSSLDQSSLNFVDIHEDWRILKISCALLPNTEKFCEIL